MGWRWRAVKRALGQAEEGLGRLQRARRIVAGAEPRGQDVRGEGEGEGGYAFGTGRPLLRRGARSVGRPVNEKRIARW